MKTLLLMSGVYLGFLGLHYLAEEHHTRRLERDQVRLIAQYETAQQLLHQAIALEQKFGQDLQDRQTAWELQFQGHERVLLAHRKRVEQLLKVVAPEAMATVMLDERLERIEEALERKEGTP